jgi:beta-glucanase (GH16 family)
MIDPATPAAAHKTQNKDTAPYNLVFSDEFNTDGRNFKAGQDPYWTAVDHFNPTTSDLEYYDSSAVTTKGGNMVITATMSPDQGHPYTSGMVTSWNQFCMTAGIVEIKVQLPGDPARPGFWCAGRVLPHQMMLLSAHSVCGRRLCLPPGLGEGRSPPRCASVLLRHR